MLIMWYGQWNLAAIRFRKNLWQQKLSSASEFLMRKQKQERQSGWDLMPGMDRNQCRPRKYSTVMNWGKSFRWNFMNTWISITVLLITAGGMEVKNIRDRFWCIKHRTIL